MPPAKETFYYYKNVSDTMDIITIIVIICVISVLFGIPIIIKAFQQVKAKRKQLEMEYAQQLRLREEERRKKEKNEAREEEKRQEKNREALKYIEEKKTKQQEEFECAAASIAKVHCQVDSDDKVPAPVMRLAAKFMASTTTDPDFLLYMGLYPEKYQEEFEKWLKHRQFSIPQTRPNQQLLHVVDNLHNWRRAVIERNPAHVCEQCGNTEAFLEAHHILPKQDGLGYENLALVVNNGIALCEECHHQVKGREVETAPMFWNILACTQGEDYIVKA